MNHQAQIKILKKKIREAQLAKKMLPNFRGIDKRLERLQRELNHFQVQAE